MDDACVIGESKKCLYRSFWRFVRKNNVEVVRRYDRLYIVLAGCNLDAFCAELGADIINGKFINGRLCVEVKEWLDVDTDELIEMGGDYPINTIY